MSRATTDLHSGWRLRLVRAAPEAQRSLLGRDVPATVPGSVHTDLMAAVHPIRRGAAPERDARAGRGVHRRPSVCPGGPRGSRHAARCLCGTVPIHPQDGLQLRLGLGAPRLSLPGSGRGCGWSAGRPAGWPAYDPRFSSTSMAPDRSPCGSTWNARATATPGSCSPPRSVGRRCRCPLPPPKAPPSSVSRFPTRAVVAARPRRPAAVPAAGHPHRCRRHDARHATPTTGTTSRSSTRPVR